VLQAALIVHAGQAVRAEALAAVVWDESPPADAIDTSQTHLIRLWRLARRTEMAPAPFQ
jgi:DNA-binding SARP family transcriptional activator